MTLDFGSLNWLAILVSIIAGQIISTLWFTVLFGEPWARAYGAASKQQHTKEIPPFTYGVAILSTALIAISIALLQQALAIGTVSSALLLGLILAVGICSASILPGQAFLKRLPVFLMTAGVQSVMILVISVILTLWR